jgi:hypothetical protein
MADRICPRLERAGEATPLRDLAEWLSSVAISAAELLGSLREPPAPDLRGARIGATDGAAPDPTQLDLEARADRAGRQVDDARVDP